MSLPRRRFWLTNSMPNALYAILRHEAIPQSHFDVMFQTDVGSKLVTWRSPTWRPQGIVGLEKIGDHRQAYLTFEGELSGNRGTVCRVEQGICLAERTADGWTIELRPIPAGERVVLRIFKSDRQWKGKMEPPQVP